MESSKAAPTGCYKCGRPGHWSRDCPDSNPNPNPNPNPDPNSSTSTSTKFNSSSSKSYPTTNSTTYSKPVAEKPKKVPRTRPKLTPEILLGDDGLGYVLRHFPRNFKFRGRGHEVSDLGNLIRLYSEWHSHLLPYYSYDEFVHKVEQVASTKRVKICLRDLRERVASGGDPTKLHELPTEFAEPSSEQDHSIPAEAVGGPSSNIHDADDLQEDMPHDIFDRVTEANVNSSKDMVQSSKSGMEPLTQNNNATTSNEVMLTDEQKARMEANRLKALERAAARAKLLQ
ncbi:uncharacterized protein LOC126660932 [Mercurialis annua]|uniref:uncharacterized protein LOC126660932 n=1 Tax=Mercurialis annua TaxID=3986 RepID=UPI002160840F|nr:uncharacterized protein LOC126660932 [Mercurialis annua]